MDSGHPEQVRKLSPPKPGAWHASHTSTRNHASLTASSVGLVCLGPARDTTSHRGTPAQIALAPALASTASPERVDDGCSSPPCMRLRCPRLAWLLALGLLAWQTGCGPAAPGDPSNIGPSANVGGPPPPSSTSANSGDTPVGLMWMATELDSQDDGTRRRALEPGAIDPLVLAYKEKDEQVLTRAMELIDQEDEAVEEDGKPGEE